MAYSNEQQKRAIELACSECELNGHTTFFERKSDLVTWADRIAWRFFRKNMPVKRSFMYCNTLDMTFFFLEDGTAVYTYAGHNDGKDDTKIADAFKKANDLRKTMERILKQNSEV